MDVADRETCARTSNPADTSSTASNPETSRLKSCCSSTSPNLEERNGPIAAGEDRRRTSSERPPSVRVGTRLMGNQLARLEISLMYPGECWSAAGSATGVRRPMLLRRTNFVSGLEAMNIVFTLADLLLA